ncbi:MAG: hypothetical protein KAJ10_01485 [Thermodesulfovibrionia bacterium]|nr:hypothetical protein [Thermodesulfovibrionia bacterium]
MEDHDKALFKTLEKNNKTATDKEFLDNLSEWIIDISGNVNVAMRLKLIAEEVK